MGRRGRILPAAGRAEAARAERKTQNSKQKKAEAARYRAMTYPSTLYSEKTPLRSTCFFTEKKRFLGQFNF